MLVRAGDRVNSASFFGPNEVNQPITIPVASAGAVRVRGQVSDRQGKPITHAKVVIYCQLLGEARQLRGTREEQRRRRGEEITGPVSTWTASTRSREVEAVFSDEQGRFTSGALWPQCRYQLMVSADGSSPLGVEQTDASGQTHDFGHLELHEIQR